LLKSEFKSPPKVSFITRGAQGIEGVHTSGLSIMQSPLIGMVRAAQLESREFECLPIDLDPDEKATQVEAAAVAAEILRGRKKDKLERGVVFRDRQRFVSRLHQIKPSKNKRYVPLTPYCLRNTANTIASLIIQPLTRVAPQSHEVEIAVCSTALNFHDVLSILKPDLFPVWERDLGGECSGVITAVGSDVHDFQVGDQVIAIAYKSFDSHVTTHYALVAKKPQSLTFDEAASIPAVSITTNYAFHRIAHLRKGQSVLIHAAAGGVGMTAIQMAQAVGAEVFVTAGTEAKRELMRLQGIKHIMDSRDFSFVDEIKKRTNGRGVDVVLNSLGGEFIPKSLEIVAPNGFFLELGKTAVWSAAQV